MLYALIVAAVVIFVAEQGDKTQVLAFALATKYRPRQVMLGIFLVNLLVLFLFTLAGRLVGSFLPKLWLWTISGVVFVLFGILALASKEEEARVDGGLGRYGPVLTTAGLFFLAEIGDQAELITMAMAANPAGPLLSLGAFGGGLSRSLVGLGVMAGTSASVATFIGVWMGAVIGITLADGMAVLAARVMGHKLPERLLRRVSGAIFLAVGILVLASASWNILAR